MMDLIENYDVKLVRLTEDKIELVRCWRNDPKISQFMEYKDYITEEMQKEWFLKINNSFNLYYIIIFEGEEIGLINIKDINKEGKSGESGVFIYSDKYLNSDISYRAHLCLFDYIFIDLGFNELHAHVLESNKRASRLTEFIGYKQISEKTFSLQKEDYLNNKNRARFIKKYNYMKSRTK